MKALLMPRYFTNLYDPGALYDEIGEDFADVAEARTAARVAAAGIIADIIVQGGIVDLEHRLEVVNDAHEVVISLTFGELFKGTASAPHLALVSSA